MKPIGGYFEWEFPNSNKQILHKDAVYLNSGRHALEYILKGLGSVKFLWIPYFTCEVVLQPLKNLNISYKFYKINKELEIDKEIILNEDEYLLYTNYYGIKDIYANQLAKKYGNKLIIDNAQALFYRASTEVNQFYSPRKFMGMPDGGLAITKFRDYSNTLPLDKSNNRCSHLLKRMELPPEESYKDFKENDAKISNIELSRMSPISKAIYYSANFESIKEKRKKNFAFLHKELESKNLLKFSSLDDFSCPLIYPYYIKNGNLIRKKLIEKQIYVATYWPNVFEWCNIDDLEYDLTDNIVCIPIDQRYESNDMERIVGEIL